MKFPGAKLFRIIAESEKSVYYRGKKALFVLCLTPLLAAFFPTDHTGDIIDILWSNLYWWGPLGALLVLAFLLFKAKGEEDVPPSGF